MSKKYKFNTYDITWCGQDCDEDCPRNRKLIPNPSHCCVSMADLLNTEYCAKSDKNKTTNREWLSKLSNEDLAKWVLEDAIQIARCYLDSKEGMAKWFSEEKYQGGEIE